jgi:hypothetical protein
MKMKQHVGKSNACVCECHLGGAVSCPGCKENHNDGHKCECCK